MPNVNGLSTTVAASEAFWNCPASFSVARGGGSGGAAEDVEEGAALPPEPVRRRRVPRVTMPLTSCGTTRLCITDGDGVGTSFPTAAATWLATNTGGLPAATLRGLHPVLRGAVQRLFQRVGERAEPAADHH
eukprot:gene10777-biopygen7833